MGRSEIDIHADDYALSVNTSKDMLKLMKEGVLDSISIVPNMSCYERCMEMLKEEIRTLPFLPLCSVHLDLVEGIRLSESTGNKTSPVNDSWGSLWLSSYDPFKRKDVKTGLKKELTAQVNKCWDSIKECIDTAKNAGIPCRQKKIRIDSHQHTHHIPVVWDALTEVIEENGYEVEYIRNSKEPLRPFLSETSLFKTYKKVNLIKNLILNFYSYKIDSYGRRSGSERKGMYLWGLIMSGRMDSYRIEKLIDQVVDKAFSDDRTLEILFHPGLMLRDEWNKEIPEKSAENFYFSPDRTVEYEAAVNLRKWVDEASGTGK
ncbi:MAG: ChbG/HpnK family deacetylase [Lachnospiraceae bacterium]|nr:ChbG/HpnK family deacetylase [Lachnospiraceae bacterium]